MDADPAALPDDIEALKIALLAERARADAAQTEAAVANFVAGFASQSPPANNPSVRVSEAPRHRRFAAK